VRKELFPELTAAPLPRVMLLELSKFVNTSADEVAGLFSPVKSHAAICANKLESVQLVTIDIASRARVPVPSLNGLPVGGD
jgi:hypothetical protein